MRATRSYFLDFTAVLLIVATHLINYVNYLNYPKFNLEVMILAIGAFLCSMVISAILWSVGTILRIILYSFLIFVFLSDAVFTFGTTDGGTVFQLFIFLLTGLLLCAYFLREHLSKILIIVFATTLGSAIIIPAVPNENHQLIQPNRISGNQKPTVIHLLLDEHIGLAGMNESVPGGAEARSEAVRLFEKYNFRVFENAYSEYFDTHATMASMFNPEQKTEINALTERKRATVHLLQNKYFQRYADEGYSINVLQSSYFDVCSSIVPVVSHCTVYRHDSFGPDVLNGLSAWQRNEVLVRMYFSSFALIKLIRLAEIQVQRLAAGNGVAVPGLGLWHGRVGPLASARDFQQFASQVANAAAGQLHFAHIMMPHHPYVYDEQCNVRPPSAWRMRSAASGLNSIQERFVRYDDYFAQLKCGLKVLDRVFERWRMSGLLERAIVIVHGDHGARIMRHNVKTNALQNFTESDFVDAYSALFAVRGPNITPGFDTRMLPLTDLLQSVREGTVSGLKEPKDPTVFVRGINNAFEPTPIPRISDITSD